VVVAGMTTLRRLADAARRGALPASGRAIVLALSLVVSGAGPARAQQDSIALILANPQKYWNLQVTVAGGTAAGTSATWLVTAASVGDPTTVDACAAQVTVG